MSSLLFTENRYDQLTEFHAQVVSATERRFIIRKMTRKLGIGEFGSVETCCGPSAPPLAAIAADAQNRVEHKALSF
jgi:hypothetical protein